MEGAGCLDRVVLQAPLTSDAEVDGSDASPVLSGAATNAADVRARFVYTERSLYQYYEVIALDMVVSELESRGIKIEITAMPATS